MHAKTPDGKIIEVIGADKVHPKLGDIVRKMILLPDNEHKFSKYTGPAMPNYNYVNRIYFDGAGYPAGLHGAWVGHDATINLKECFRTAVVATQERPELSCLALAWHFVLRCVFHELFHAWAEHPKVADPNDEVEEEEAEMFSESQVVLMAMLYDIEMPDMEDMGLLTELFHEAVDEHLEADPTNMWAQIQAELFRDGDIYHEGTLVIDSYREFVRSISSRDDDYRWGEKPAAVSAENVAPETPQPPKESPTAPSPAPTPSHPVAPPTPPPTPSSPEVDPTPPAPSVSEAPEVHEPTVTPTERYFDDGPPMPEDEEYFEADRGEIMPGPAPVHVVAPQKAFDGPMEEIVSTMQAIYVRLARYMFDKCQWNGQGYFGNPAGVLEPVYVGDLPYAEQLLVSCDSLNHKGQKAERQIIKHAKGTVFSNSKLPAYVLYVNINGKKCKRVLVPQNADKESKSAKNARNGDRIVWVINGDMSDTDVENARANGGRASKFIAMIKNDQYIVLK